MEKGTTSTSPFKYTGAAEFLAKYPKFIDPEGKNQHTERSADDTVCFTVRGEDDRFANNGTNLAGGNMLTT